MDKFIKPDKSVKSVAEELVDHLTKSMLCIGKLWDRYEESIICTKSEPPIYFRACLKLLSTVIKRVKSSYLGHSDFEHSFNSWDKSESELGGAYDNK